MVCVLGAALGIVVAGGAARDLVILADLPDLPVQKSLDVGKLSSNPRLQELAAAWRSESTAAINSFRAASAAALALARSGAQERVVLGISFAAILGFVALQISRSSRKM